MKKSKFPKNFSSEKSFKNFIKSNRNYILTILSENQFLWNEERYVCDSTILIFAVRYAIGRKTGAVTRLVDWILEEWERISYEEREVIVKEILEYERLYGNLGQEWNRELWYRIINKQLFGLIEEIN